MKYSLILLVILLAFAFGKKLSQQEVALCAKVFPRAEPENYPSLLEALNHRVKHMENYTSHHVSACTPFPKSPTKPTNVNCVRYSDIEVVGAIGDSLTAGVGAACSNVFCMTTEYRGAVWTIGNDAGRTSMPRFLTELGATVSGYSVGTGSDCRSNPNAGYNCGISGAIGSGMPGQAQTLTEKIIETGDADKWKIISLFIGGNNLCDACKTRGENDPHDPVKYRTDVGLALLEFKKLPNTIINLISIVDVIKLNPFIKGATCNLLIPSLCPCVVGTQEEKDYTRLLAAQYQLGFDQLASDPAFNTNNFKVIVQPCFVETDIPRDENGVPDDSFFGLDCFHFSVKAHDAVGIALAHNLQQTPGQKQMNVDFGLDTWVCPAAPLIPTGTPCPGNQ